MSQPPPKSTTSIDGAAARWLARRDRELTPREQDEYLQWLCEDPRHAAALARQEATLERMQRLGEWQPMLRDEPNPDLFAPPRRRRRWALWSATAGVLAAAAALMVVLRPVVETPVPVLPRAEKSYLRVNERQALSDGSVVELKDGSRVAVDYSPSVRRVRLTGGEAYFTVAKDAARPFIVEAAGTKVQAVGTVFNVRLDVSAVEVLVTEGKVKLATGEMDAAQPVPLLTAGERAILSREAASAAPQIAHLTQAQINEALSWQIPRLQFKETPLAEAVSDFNRHASGEGAGKLVLGQTALGTVRIGGTFRVDNLAGFVHMLEVTMDIRGERLANGDILLLAAH